MGWMHSVAEMPDVPPTRKGKTARSALLELGSCGVCLDPVVVAIEVVILFHKIACGTLLEPRKRRYH